MSDYDGFFQLILLGVGVIFVFFLLASMGGYFETEGFVGIDSPLDDSGTWKKVFDKLVPLMGVICFLGFAAYVVANR